jgi:hypothetical protein
MSADSSRTAPPADSPRRAASSSSRKRSFSRRSRSPRVAAPRVLARHVRVKNGTMTYTAAFEPPYTKLVVKVYVQVGGVWYVAQSGYTHRKAL